MQQPPKKESDNRLIARLLFFSAERKGFEPLVPHSTTVFKTAAIDHSAISPKKRLQRYNHYFNFKKIIEINYKKTALHNV